MAVYSLRLLGSPVIQGPGGPVTGRAAYRRRVALLSMLAVARGRPVGRDRIIGLLWSEHPADAARHTLSEALYVLRKDLSDELFVTVGDDVALNPAVLDSDVAAFEEAVESGRPEEAVRAWGGPLLDGFYVSDAPEFERWVDGERDRLDRVYAQTLEALALALEAGGDPAGAAEWWRRLAAHDRYSSRVAMRLVRALDAAGDRMAALRFAGTHAVLLREELGCEPDRELTELVARLRAEPRCIPTLPPPITIEAPPAPPTAPGTDPSESGAAEGTASASGIAADAAHAAEDAGALDGAEVANFGAVEGTASADGSASEDAGAAEGTASAGGITAEDAGAVDGAEVGPSRADPEMPADPPAASPHESALSPPAETSADPEGPLAPGAGLETPADHPPTLAVAAQAPPSASRPARARRRMAGAALVALAAAITLALLPLASAPAEPAPRYDPRRIAVLYLEDYSPDGGLAYLANGLTEMLIAQLAQVQALDVVSRNGVKPYRDRAVPFDSLAAALRAGSVVEGSVQRSGDSVRVTVQLVDAATQLQLESRSLTYPLHPESLFALQDAVAAEVAGFLRRRVGREIRLSDLRRRARNPRALEMVLRAMHARDDAVRLAPGTHARDVASALRGLQAADSLLALAQRADGDWPEPVLLRGWVGVDQSRLLRDPARMAVLHEARRRAQAVLRDEPENADARELRGTVLWQMVAAEPQAARGRPWLAQAERDLRAAVLAEPGRASAWATLSQLLRLGGDLAEAELAARSAHQHDAYLEVAEVGPERLYRVALALGDYARARHWCDQGRLRFPTEFRFWDCALVLLARDPSLPASPDSAWRLLAHGNRLDPPAAAVAAGRPYPAVFRRMMVAAVLARAGLADSARAVSARARGQVQAHPELRISFLWDDAYVALLLGDRARAAALLNRFVAARPAFREYVLREPAFRGVWPP